MEAFEANMDKKVHQAKENLKSAVKKEIRKRDFEKENN